MIAWIKYVKICYDIKIYNPLKTMKMYTFQTIIQIMKLLPAEGTDPVSGFRLFHIRRAIGEYIMAAHLKHIFEG